MVNKIDNILCTNKTIESILISLHVKIIDSKQTSNLLQQTEEYMNINSLTNTFLMSINKKA